MYIKVVTKVVKQLQINITQQRKKKKRINSAKEKLTEECGGFTSLSCSPPKSKELRAAATYVMSMD